MEIKKFWSGLSARLERREIENRSGRASYETVLRVIHAENAGRFPTCGCEIVFRASLFTGKTSAVAFRNRLIMSHPTTHQVTRLLLAWGGGDAAPDQLMALVYGELRHLARGYLRRERDNHTLQPTALVNEAYLRLVDEKQIDWRSRAQFYGIAARVMRQILVDHARRNNAAKRGGLLEKVPLEFAGDFVQDAVVDFVALDAALETLAHDFPRPSRVVELRFFGGMTAQEIGEVLQVTDRTIERDWEFARWWLSRELKQGVKDSDPSSKEKQPHET